MTTKVARQQKILRIVEDKHLSTQADLADALRTEGIDTVQATVSRDIAALGLVKVRNGNGRLVYALPGAADLRRIEEVAAALRRWALAMTPSGQILVITTHNGLAAPLAYAIDEAGLADVAGTIAGENTVFVAASDGATGAALEEQFRHHLEGDQ
ncbi:MAG: arginine repressor [Actinomycetes bacterium]